MQAYIVTKIGENKGAPRIWVEGTRVARSGFMPGTHYSVTSERGRLTLKVCEDGTRVVSIRRRGERELPIIDLNSQDISKAFAGIEVVRVILRENEIHVLPLATELKRQERVNRVLERMRSGLPMRVGSVSHGGGVLSHAIHAGLTQAGVVSTLAFANEIRSEMIDQAQDFNSAWSKETIALCAPVQQLAADVWAMKQLPSVEILEAGLPCSGASPAGRAKRGLKLPECHPEVGHLCHAFLQIVQQVNPAVVLLENVPAYFNSASSFILRTQLQDLGYEISEVEVRGSEWGALEDRKRGCMLAVTRGLDMSLEHLVAPNIDPGKLSDILDDDPRWSGMPGLKAKQERDILAGKGFRMSICTGEETHIGTLTKGISRNRSTDPKIQCATNPSMLRIPTPTEHARAKGIPESLIQGLCATTAHELLGQSVIYSPFVAIGALIGKALRDNAAALPLPLAA